MVMKDDLFDFENVVIVHGAFGGRHHWKRVATSLQNELGKPVYRAALTGQGERCHLINEEYALFTDNKLHNTGHGYAVSMGIKPEKTRVQLAPGVFVDVDTEIIDSVRQQPKENDVGLYTVTQNPFDRWKFRTSILRNIELTAPYMHDGAFNSLKSVVEFYNQGGVPNELLSPLIKPLNLTDQEVDQIVAFLRSLTGDNIETIVADAFAAPIGDLRQEDPNWAHETDLNSK